MKLYIIRQGSGWGGYRGNYLVNLDNMSYTEIQEDEAQIDRYVDWLKNLEHHSTDLSLKGSYSMLKDVDNAKSVRTPVSFDMQSDVVYTINHGKVTPVYSPCSCYYITIEDKILRDKMVELIKEVSGQPMRDSSKSDMSDLVIGEVESDEVARKMINMATIHSKI